MEYRAPAPMCGGGPVESVPASESDVRQSSWGSRERERCELRQRSLIHKTQTLLGQSAERPSTFDSPLPPTWNTIVNLRTASTSSSNELVVWAGRMIESKW